MRLEMLSHHVCNWMQQEVVTQNWRYKSLESVRGQSEPKNKGRKGAISIPAVSLGLVRVMGKYWIYY